MADENMTPDAGDPGETMNMGSGDATGADIEPKKEKKPGDWVTVEMPKVQKPAPASQPAAPPPMKETDAERTVLEGSSAPSAPSSMGGPKAQPTPSAPAMGGFSTTPPIIESAPASSGGMAWMEGIGIKDPGTQKIVLFGGGGALLLCCLCSCIATVVTFVLPLMAN